MSFLSNKLFSGLLIFAILAVSVSVGVAQTPATDVVMVLPFENTSALPEYNWVGESFADAIAELLKRGGLVAVSSDERELAYQRLRLP